ncbi:unnamed protein product, partial [Rotaria sp. Silwood1]|jgi:hypothetical protein
MEVGR